MAECEDADVPPLEDLSEVLECARAARPQLQRKKPNPSPGGRERPCPNSNGTSVKTAASVESGASQSESSPKRPRAEKTKRKVAEGAGRDREGFGGFGRGFLLSTPAEKTVKNVSRNSGANESTGTAGGNATPSSKTSTVQGERFSSGTFPTASDDIPFLRAQPQAAANRGPVFPEVQEAMKEAYPLLNTQDWVTESLLEKIKRHPLLSRALTDPHLAEVLSRFQSNPKEALQLSAGNPEMQHFLKEFCNLMGDHFTELADKEGRGKEKQTATAPLVDDEVKRVLEKKAVKDALSDPEVQQLISSLQRDRNKAQRFLTAGSTELRKKVQVLIDNGLLAMQ